MVKNVTFDFSFLHNSEKLLEIFCKFWKDLKRYTRWRLRSNFKDELVGGGSLIVGDDELVLVADVLLLEVVDGQGHRVLAREVLERITIKSAKTMRHHAKKQ